MNVFLFKNTDNEPSILDNCPFFRMVAFFLVNGFFSGSCLALSIWSLCPHLWTFPFEKGGGLWCQQANFNSCHAGKFTVLRHLEWTRNKTPPNTLKLLLPCKNNRKTCFLVPVVLVMVKYWNWIILSSHKKNWEVRKELRGTQKLLKKIWCLPVECCSCAVTLNALKWDFWVVFR